MSEPSTERTAIVTGAGSGVGRATAVRLAGLGWRVALVGRTEGTLEGTARLAGGGCVVVAGDLSTGAEGVAERAIGELGRVDALVNNAGMASLVGIGEVTVETLLESFSVNTVGPGVLIAKVFPVMRRQGGGRVVNVASAAVRDPFPGFFAYAAAKSALDSFTRSVENEGSRRGVRGFTVAPGAVETGMLRALFSVDALPRTHTLDPEAVAELIVECATGARDDEAGRTIYLTPG